MKIKEILPIEQAAQTPKQREQANWTPQRRYQERIRELRRSQGLLNKPGRPKSTIQRYRISINVCPEEELMIREFLNEMRNREAKGELK